MNFDASRLSHAYITDSSTANTIAMTVVCSASESTGPCRRCASCNKASRGIHPDITIVGKLEDKNIVSVEQIRELKKDIYIVPNEASKKAYIVNDADKMNTNAQNAFLQILEEPPVHAVFILSTDNPAALLPTVRSRCVQAKRTQTASGEKDTESCEQTKAHDDHNARGVLNSRDSSDASDVAAELASELITALNGDNVKLMECMFRLDKLDRAAFSVFLNTAKEHVVATLKENLTNVDNNTNHNEQLCKALVNAESIFSKAGTMLTLNVSSGHISGFICASLIRAN